MKNTTNNRSKRRLQRMRGQSVVEFALTFPVLLLLGLLGIELGNMVYMSNLISTASREGAKIGSENLATSVDIYAVAINHAQRVLEDGGLPRYKVIVEAKKTTKLITSPTKQTLEFLEVTIRDYEPTLFFTPIVEGVSNIAAAFFDQWNPPARIKLRSRAVSYVKSVP